MKLWRRSFSTNQAFPYRCLLQRGQSVSHSEAEKRLLSLKKEFPFLADVSSVILQQTLRDQQDTFKNFWAGRSKYPKFKKNIHAIAFPTVLAVTGIGFDSMLTERSHKVPSSHVFTYGDAGWFRRKLSAPADIQRLFTLSDEQLAILLVELAFVLPPVNVPKLRTGQRSL